MGNELVSSLFPTDEETIQPTRKYYEIFYEQFPFYLSIGMTYEQYWEGDSSLVKYYRDAFLLQKDRKNEELWLQGMYIYEAICDASPILHAFAKKGTKPHPYVDKPYALTEKRRKQDAEDENKAVFDKGKQFMEAFMKSFNTKFKDDAQSDRR